MAVNKVTTWTANFTGIETPDQFITQMNTNLNNMLGASILFTVFFVSMLLLMTQGDFKRAFASASFTSTLVAWLLWIINWISSFYLILFIILSLGGLVAIWSTPD
jgi:hypothetical protein